MIATLIKVCYMQAFMQRQAVATYNDVQWTLLKDTPNKGQSTFNLCM